MPRKAKGLVVPFGDVASRGWFDLTFGPGRLSISDVGRVPFMFEHGATFEVAGVMTDVEETAEGIVGTFDLDDTPAGDRAAAEFASGSRTGLSMGVEYDDETLEAIYAAFWDFDSDERPLIEGGGAIREVSHVATPAFDAARAELITETAEQTAGSNEGE